MSAEFQARTAFSYVSVTFSVIAALTFHPAALAAQTAPTVTVASTTAMPGAAVTVTIANGPGNQTDWVALVPASAADTGYLTWAYLNGLQTAPAVGLTAATLTFSMPATPGAYNLRLFANNSPTKLATSATVTVS